MIAKIICFISGHKWKECLCERCFEYKYKHRSLKFGDLCEECGKKVEHSFYENPSYPFDKTCRKCGEKKYLSQEELWDMGYGQYP